LAEIKGIVPSYRSLLIYYDSNATSFESLRDRVRDIGHQAANVTSQTRNLPSFSGRIFRLTFSRRIAA
jgi:allophanate hydrolase subunit 1